MTCRKQPSSRDRLGVRAGRSQDRPRPHASGKEAFDGSPETRLPFSRALLFAVAVVAWSTATQSSILFAQPQSAGRNPARPELSTDAYLMTRTGEHKYVLFVPRNYAADKKWPVILYLHGAAERGTDGDCKRPSDWVRT